MSNVLFKMSMIGMLLAQIIGMNKSLARTKTSIRYAKENDRDKTERRRERKRKVEGEI